MFANLPLNGIRVLDITVVWAGPYSTMFLGDMGAEVIRVESVNIFPSATRGRFAHPSKEAEQKAPTSLYPDRDPGERPWNRSALFNGHARNKLSMTADLKTEKGKEAFRRLVEISDVFIENNALGSMERLGLTYDNVRSWNPKIIMVSSTGMGQTGPWSHFRGFGSHFEALYGHASVTGYPDLDATNTPGSVAADAAAGVAIAFAVVTALHNRNKTGEGAFIDLSQGENFVHHLGEYFMDFSMNGTISGPSGNRSPLYIQGCYSCRGADEQIIISLGSFDEWKTLCSIMNKPELLSDVRFKSMETLHEHHDEIDEIIGKWTMKFDPIELFHHLQNSGIVCGPVIHEEHAFNDPHLKERGFFVPITQEDVGTHLYPGQAFKLSENPFQVRKPPVLLGEDNNYVYQELLNLSHDEYQALKDLGYVAMEYAPHVR